MKKNAREKKSLKTIAVRPHRRGKSPTEPPRLNEANSKTITIRKIESSLAKNLKAMAAKEGKSVNQFVLDTLKEKTGMKKEKRFTKTYHDLDSLFGRWPDSEFQRVQDNINEQRKIDKALWK